MRRLQLAGLVALVAVFAVPREGSAQIAERIRRERMEHERLERHRDRYDRHDRDRARRGPPFCRNGRGHPVHGRRWCVEKGFGMSGRGRGHALRDYRWERVRWVDVVILDGRYDSRRYERRDDRYGRDDGWLRNVIGDAVYGRLVGHSRSLGWSEPLRGEWFFEDRLRVLSVHAGDRPVAELIDLDGDGRVEEVRLIRRR